MKELTLILFLFMIGCYGNNNDLSGDTTAYPPIVSYKDNVISVWVEQGFSKVQLLQINDSILEWNIVFNGARVLSVVNWNIERTKNNLDIVYRNKDLLILRTSSEALGENYIPGLLGFATQDYGGKTVYLLADFIDPYPYSTFGIIIIIITLILNLSKNNLHYYI